MDEVFRNEHWKVERDPGRPLLIVRRSAQRYVEIADVEASFRGLEAALDAQDRRSLVLLLDMTSGPFRNDLEFEQAATSHPQRFARGFLRMAVIVRTAAGRLQAQRYFRERGVEPTLFTDEMEAAHYLLAPPSNRRPPTFR